VEVRVSGPALTRSHGSRASPMGSQAVNPLGLLMPGRSVRSSVVVDALLWRVRVPAPEIVPRRSDVGRPCSRTRTDARLGVSGPAPPSREGRAAYGDTCSVGGGPSVHTADKAPCADVPPTRARDDPPPAAPGGREKAESGERNAASEKRAREAPLVTRSKQRTIPVVYDIGRLRRSARTSKTPYL